MQRINPRRGMRTGRRKVLARLSKRKTPRLWAHGHDRQSHRYRSVSRGMVAQKSAALRLLLAWCRLTKGLAASAGRIEDADSRGSGGELARCPPSGAQRRRHGGAVWRTRWRKGNSEAIARRRSRRLTRTSQKPLFRRRRGLRHSFSQRQQGPPPARKSHEG